MTCAKPWIGRLQPCRAQLIVLNWFFAAYADNLPAERILRYEDLIATGGATLFKRLGHPDAPTQPLASRNNHAAYRDVVIAELYAALVDTGGAWTRFYDARDCARAADAMSAG